MSGRPDGVCTTFVDGTLSPVLARDRLGAPEKQDPPSAHVPIATMRNRSTNDDVSSRNQYGGVLTRGDRIYSSIAEAMSQKIDHQPEVVGVGELT